MPILIDTYNYRGDQFHKTHGTRPKLELWRLILKRDQHSQTGLINYNHGHIDSSLLVYLLLLFLVHEVKSPFIIWSCARGWRCDMIFVGPKGPRVLTHEAYCSIFMDTLLISPPPPAHTSQTFHIQWVGKVDQVSVTFFAPLLSIAYSYFFTLRIHVNIRIYIYIRFG